MSNVVELTTSIENTTRGVVRVSKGGDLFTSGTFLFEIEPGETWTVVHTSRDELHARHDDGSPALVRTTDGVNHYRHPEEVS